MKRFALTLGLIAFAATPALAALKEGAKAPDFAAKGFLAGKPFDFSWHPLRHPRLRGHAGNRVRRAAPVLALTR